MGVFWIPAKNGDFIEQDKKKRTIMYCKLCQKKMNYQGNTMNMMAHLQYNHRAEYLKVKAKSSPLIQARSASQWSSKQPAITK